MFTLSAMFLEDGEILFQDFWSPFSISFLRFSARRNILEKKKVTALPGHVRLGHRPGRPFKRQGLEPPPAPARSRAPPNHKPPPRLAAAAVPPFRRRRAAVGAADLHRAAAVDFSPVGFFRNPSPFFFFRSVFLLVFLVRLNCGRSSVRSF